VLKATFDTNVYVSALRGGRVASRLLGAAEEGAFALQISQPILDEVAEVLEREFGRTKERTDIIRQALSEISQQVVPHLQLDVVKDDPDDNAILECSQASNSDYVVTSDKHLLKLGRYAGADIIEPQRFLALLKQRGRAL
jgi:uncharacterized protein